MSLSELYEKIYLPEVVGKGYKEFWNFKGRYRVVKGSRASKKSKTTALWYIYNLMKYPRRQFAGSKENIPNTERQLLY